MEVDLAGYVFHMADAAGQEAEDDPKERRIKAKSNHYTSILISVYQIETFYPNCFLFNLSAFQTTETELNAIAALAIIGLNNTPKNGYRTPAAIGTPNTL